MKTLYFIFIVITLITLGCKKDSNSNDTIKDFEGNVYHMVAIGTQVWLMENLKSTRYNDGSAIPLVGEAAAWKNLSTAGYCWYDNDSLNYANTFGALYNWNAINTGKLAPVGWHVATDADWNTLITYLGGDTVAGGKLKEAGTSHWATPNTGATNISGFTALPGGYRNTDGDFLEINQSGNWWSSTSNSTDKAYFRGMAYNRAIITRGIYNRKFGFSARCVKD